MPITGRSCGHPEGGLPGDLGYRRQPAALLRHRLGQDEEAAFLPVLTELYRHPAQSVGVLYISPLKALINDQFKRLDQLLLESGLPVCKWHGDASRTEKERLVKHPQGIFADHAGIAGIPADPQAGSLLFPVSRPALCHHRRGALLHAGMCGACRCCLCWSGCSACPPMCPGASACPPRWGISGPPSSG